MDNHEKYNVEILQTHDSELKLFLESPGSQEYEDESDCILEIALAINSSFTDMVRKYKDMRSKLLLKCATPISCWVKPKDVLEQQPKSASNVTSPLGALIAKPLSDNVPQPLRSAMSHPISHSSGPSPHHDGNNAPPTVTKATVKNQSVDISPGLLNFTHPDPPSEYTQGRVRSLSVRDLLPPQPHSIMNNEVEIMIRFLTDIDRQALKQGGGGGLGGEGSVSLQ